MILRGKIGLGDMVGEDLGLVPQWRDEAIDLPAMLRAFADDVDPRIVDRAHMIVDDDRAFDGQAAVAPDLGIGADAGRDDDHVAVDAGAVLELEPGDASVGMEAGVGGRFGEVDGDPHLLHFLRQHRAAGSVELHFHQVSREMDDMDFGAMVEQPARGLEAKQAAADDRCLA